MNFLLGMLTNLGPLGAERIHQMLTLFVQGPNKYDRQIEELRVTFLFLISFKGSKKLNKKF